MKANTTFAFDFNSYNYFNYSNSYPIIYLLISQSYILY